MPKRKVVSIDGIYEILMNQLPFWFKPVLEYIAIMKAWGFVLWMIEEDAGLVESNLFIQTADSDTLLQWERLMGITSAPTDTLEFRRERILTRISQTVPFTYWHLKERLTELFGDQFELTVNPAECSLEILVTSGRYGAVTLLNDLIYNNIPAHLDVTSNQEVSNFIVSNQYIAAFLIHSLEKTVKIKGSTSEGATQYSGAAVQRSVITGV